MELQYRKGYFPDSVAQCMGTVGVAILVFS
uniref:Uncharacterized protein n=1 Tax=Anguilla anguilla TaxID=7936 RepID=A0A0E9PR63_ANGAN